MFSRAGRVYAASGKERVIEVGPAETLTNRTVTGSGDYLVDRATGAPEKLAATLPAGQSQQWFKFTTLGNGLPGNGIGIDQDNQMTVSIAAQAAESREGFNGRGSVSLKLGATQDILRDIAVDHKGRYVAVGWSLNAANNQDLAVVRYLPDGFARLDLWYLGSSSCPN